LIRVVVAAHTVYSVLSLVSNAILNPVKTRLDRVITKLNTTPN